MNSIVKTFVPDKRIGRAEKARLLLGPVGRGPCTAPASFGVTPPSHGEWPNACNPRGGRPHEAAAEHVAEPDDQVARIQVHFSADLHFWRSAVVRISSCYKKSAPWDAPYSEFPDFKGKLEFKNG